MPKKQRAKHRPQQTHLGWRTGQAEGLNGPDHLLLSGSWQENSQQHASGDSPTLEFLDAKPSKTCRYLNSSATDDTIDFLEVQDTQFESPAFLWDANWSADQIPVAHEQDVVVFEESGSVENDSATIFS
jgi:hypothetical protein